MSKPILFVFVALSVGIAPRLAAQAPERQARVAVPPATVARTEVVKTKNKGTVIPRPSAQQRAPDPSKMVIVVGPNGERRVLRAKKRTN
jgi:hypothetical protein